MLTNQSSDAKTIWKYLTLTGTFRAQSSFGKNSNIFFLNRPFGYQNHHFHNYRPPITAPSKLPADRCQPVVQ